MENQLTLTITTEEAALLRKIADSIREDNAAQPVTLQNLSAQEIFTICQHGNPQESWNVGDEKEITLKSGEKITLQIAGFNHDTKPDGTTAAVTFITRDCLNFPLCINYDYDNAGGWAKSEIRNRLNTSVLALLPDEWQEVIACVEKRTSEGGESKDIVTSVDKLWMPSEVEIFGEAKYSVPGEGSQYEIFKSENNRRKKRCGAAAPWWERSPHAADATTFCIVYASGTAGNYAASDSLGVAFGLCV